MISCVDKSKSQLWAISGSLRKGQIYFKVGHSQFKNRHFNCIKTRNDLLYIGLGNGDILILESLTGKYVKEIPYQPKLFSQLKSEHGNLAAFPVSNLQIND